MVFDWLTNISVGVDANGHRKLFLRDYRSSPTTVREDRFPVQTVVVPDLIEVLREVILRLFLGQWRNIDRNWKGELSFWFLARRGKLSLVFIAPFFSIIDGHLLLFCLQLLLVFNYLQIVVLIDIGATVTATAEK